MSDEAAFLAAIAADPADGLGYLVFADWLQEQGEEARAGLVRDPRTRPLLGPTLADPFPGLKDLLRNRADFASARDRCMMFGAACLPTLAEVLRNPADEQSRLHALDCIREMGTAARPLLTTLLPLIGHADSAVKYRADAAFRALRVRGLPLTEPVVAAIRSLAAGGSTMRSNEVGAIGVFGEDSIRSEVLPRIDRELASHDPEIRRIAVRALVNFALPEARERIAGMVGDPDERVRVAAVWALGLETYGNSDPLAHALRDPSVEVRRVAAKGLSGNRSAADPRVVAALRRGLFDPDPSVAADCLESLTSKGAEAAAALPDLLACLPGAAPPWWVSILKAIHRISPGHPAVNAEVRARSLDPDRLGDVVPILELIGETDRDAVDAVLQSVRSLPTGDIYWRQWILRWALGLRPVPHEAIEAFREVLAGTLLIASTFSEFVGRLREPAEAVLAEIEARLVGGDLSAAPVLAIGGSGGVMRLVALRHERRGDPRMVAAIAEALSARTAGTSASPDPREAGTLVERILRAEWGPHPVVGPGTVDRQLAEFHGWLETSPDYGLPVWRPAVHRAILDAMMMARRTGWRRDLYATHAGSILRTTAEAFRAGLIPADQIDRAWLVLSKVCGLAFQLAKFARPMAPGIADILAGEFGTPTTLVTRRAARALGRLGDPIVAPVLIPLLRHLDEPVAMAAAVSLGRMRCSVAAVGLIEALGDNRPRVRRESATALGRVGAFGDVPLERLRALTADDDAEVRAAAVRAHDWLSGVAFQKRSAPEVSHLDRRPRRE